jgi:uncharacterized protein YjbJ (UPF0337 family)
MMKPSMDDKTTGKLHEVKGTLKEKIGELTRSPDQEADGRAERMPAKFKLGRQGRKACGRIS